MTRTRRNLRDRRPILAAAAALALSVWPSAALAQSGKEPPKPEDAKGYTLPYFFSGLAVLAVVVTVCWPSPRRFDIVAEEED